MNALHSILRIIRTGSIVLLTLGYIAFATAGMLHEFQHQAGGHTRIEATKSSTNDPSGKQDSPASGDQLCFFCIHSVISTSSEIVVFQSPILLQQCITQPDFPERVLLRTPFSSPLRGPPSC